MLTQLTNRRCALLIWLMIQVPTAIAELWVDSRDAHLRTDIDRLAQAGVISVPVNTWPLMWSGLLVDLESTPLAKVPKNLIDNYLRVRAAGTMATDSHKTPLSLTMTAANAAKPTQHFGVTGRARGSVSLRDRRTVGRGSSNIEVNIAADPWDNDTIRYDHSYLGVMIGNWYTTLGAVERWWGPGWNSSLIMSNNARPPPGILVQRNQSFASKLPLLSYLGPWTASVSIAHLDDDRYVANAKLIGMTLGIRPRRDLEINFRRSAQWGGENRPEDLGNLVSLITGLADNCDDAACRLNEPGNQLGGIDFRWTIPKLNAAIYAQTVGEDEAGGLPSRRASQFGVQMSLDTAGYSGIAFAEYTDTSIRSFDSHYNILYNHSIYKTGYRYRGRAIGATWDNDSQVFSLGTLGRSVNGDLFDLRYSYGSINKDSLDSGLPTPHSVSPSGSDLSRFSASWQRAYRWGSLKINARYNKNPMTDFDSNAVPFQIGGSIRYSIR